MSAMISLAMLLVPGTAAAVPDAPTELAPAAVKQLARGVHRDRSFRGWRTEFVADALQEACLLALEHHPQLPGMTDEQVRTTRVDVPLRDGRVVNKPLENHLVELGIKARNAVLRDNHLNRQTDGRIASHGAYADDAGYALRRFGRRTLPHTLE